MFAWCVESNCSRQRRLRTSPRGGKEGRRRIPAAMSSHLQILDLLDLCSNCAHLTFTTALDTQLELGRCPICGIPTPGQKRPENSSVWAEDSTETHYFRDPYLAKASMHLCNGCDRIVQDERVWELRKRNETAPGAAAACATSGAGRAEPAARRSERRERPPCASARASRAKPSRTTRTRSLSACVPAARAPLRCLAHAIAVCVITSAPK